MAVFVCFSSIFNVRRDEWQVLGLTEERYETTKL
jgi:hypothetical protein